jgi:hypothetical protein
LLHHITIHVVIFCMRLPLRKCRIFCFRSHTSWIPEPSLAVGVNIFFSSSCVVWRYRRCVKPIPHLRRRSEFQAGNKPLQARPTPVTYKQYSNVFLENMQPVRVLFFNYCQYKSVSWFI